MVTQTTKATRVNESGHILIYRPDHPGAYVSENWKGYVYEHRFIIEKELGRSLAPGEEVHHLDGDPGNNRSENLIVLNRKMHVRLHEWLSKGAPYCENLGMNGVNSEKAKPSPRCGICNLILQQKQRQYCSVTCLRLGKDAGSLRPDVEVLKQDLQNTSYVKVGKKYGVSDNGVRYWVKRYIEEGKLTLSQADSTLSEGATTT